MYNVFNMPIILIKTIMLIMHYKASEILTMHHWAIAMLFMHYVACYNA